MSNVFSTFNRYAVYIPQAKAWGFDGAVLNSTSTIGESFTLPPDDPHSIQISDGTYTDDEGILWTKIRVTTSSGDQWQFLERVDTSVSPHRLYVVVTVDDNGLPTLAYGEYPFGLPGHNVQIWEKQ